MGGARSRSDPRAVGSRRRLGDLRLLAAREQRQEQRFQVHFLMVPVSSEVTLSGRHEKGGLKPPFPLLQCRVTPQADSASPHRSCIA